MATIRKCNISNNLQKKSFKYLLHVILSNTFSYDWHVIKYFSSKGGIFVLKGFCNEIYEVSELFFVAFTERNVYKRNKIAEVNGISKNLPRKKFNYIIIQFIIKKLFSEHKIVELTL